MRTFIFNLKTLFQTSLASVITTFMAGSVEVIAKSDLPMLTITPMTTRIKRHGTVRCLTEHEVLIEVYINMGQYFDTTTGQQTTIDTLDKLQEIMEDRDADGDLQSDTVAGTIMQNVSVSDYVLSTDNIEIRYDRFDKAEYPHWKASLIVIGYYRPNNT